MNYKSKPFSSWLITVILLVVISLLWFFSDLKNTEKIQTISDVEQKIAEPLPDELAIEVLDQFTTKLAISESDLASTQPYASVAKQNTNVTVQSTITDNTNNNDTNQTQTATEPVTP